MRVGGVWQPDRRSAARRPRYGRPGRIVEELRRVGVRNPVFVLDEIDRLHEGGAAAALFDAVDPGTAFRDRYLDLPVDLSGALFVGHGDKSRIGAADAAGTDAGARAARPPPTVSDVGV